MLKYVLSISILGIFVCCGVNQKAQIESITIKELPKQEKQALMEMVVDGESKEELTERIVSVPEFPVAFTTMVPESIQYYHSISDYGSAYFYKLNDATLSFNLLPNEYKSIKEGEKYVKQILSTIADEVKMQEDGLLRGKSLARYQEAEVGQTGNTIYYWLTDYPFDDSAIFPQYVEVIKDQFLLIQPN